MVRVSSLLKSYYSVYANCRFSAIWNSPERNYANRRVWVKNCGLVRRKRLDSIGEVFCLRMRWRLGQQDQNLPPSEKSRVKFFFGLENVALSIHA